jgi:DNA-binding response OmpR family regulator
LPTVLVVDAHRGFAAGLGRALSSRGFAVLLAGTASEASALVRGGRPDVVVLDMQLPDRSGFELCRELRENGTAPGRPILIATSLTATPDVIAGMARSADDYLIKPYAIDALATRINQHLVRPAAREPRPCSMRSLPGDRRGPTKPAGVPPARPASRPGDSCPSAI